MHFKYYKIPALIVGLMLITASCKDAIVDNKLANLPPNTTVFVDTVRTTQITKMKLYWNGDDPDGYVVGYLYSLDSARTWNFTTSTSKDVTIPTLGYDSLLTQILVSAVDNSGNGTYDEVVKFRDKNIGHEFFVDANNSGTFDAGEKYTDYGAIDPTPASFFVRVKNSPPVASFNASAEIPSLTLPVATFILQVSDPDGLDGIEHFQVALNDTAQSAWIEIPKFTTVLTLKADFTDTISTVLSAQVLTGFEAKPTDVQIPNMKINANNRLYFRVKDNTGATSNIAAMPDSSKNWFVTKSQSGGKLLLIRDHYSHQYNDQDLLQSVLAQTPTSTPGKTYSKVDVLYLKNPAGNQIIPSFIRNTMVSSLLGNFSKVIWYGGDNTNYQLAQSVIPNYISKTGKKGKILFRGGFALGQTGRDLSLDFLPVDSLNATFYYKNGTKGTGFRRTANNLTMVRDLTNSDFPVAKPDPAAFTALPDSLASSVFAGSPMGTFYSFVPNQNAFVLYRLSLPRSQTTTSDLYWPSNAPVYYGSGTPVVMIENTDRNLVFTTLPFNYFSRVVPGYPKTVNGNTFPTPLQELLYNILSVEFER